MKLIQSIRLYFDTIRYLRPQQVADLVRARLARRFIASRLPAAPNDLDGRLPNHNAFPNHDPWNTREDILKGNFSFLNHSISLGSPVDWKPIDASALWQFNLHYFNYLYLLQPDERISLCLEWIENNPAGIGAGWHPYPTSLRVVNWCKSGVRTPAVMRSLYEQAAFVFRNLETGVSGNHLLENARALVFGGTFFSDHGEACDWLEKGLEIFRDQIPEQILPDGGHFERSPMYHAIVLEGIIDLLALLPSDYADRNWLAQTVLKMGCFLVSMSHDDGRLLLFNDSTREIALQTSELLHYMRIHAPSTLTQKNAFPETGYYLHRTDDVFLAIDGGSIGPDHVPGHAHADIFSYELSFGGQEFVVDSGVSEYEIGPMRAYARSTAAHNTVSIDGTDQAECWSSFRVGRRYTPDDVSFNMRGGRSTFHGKYSGFGKLIGDHIRHDRTIHTDEMRREISVEDYIDGRNIHLVESRIHFHPSVQIREDADRYLLTKNCITCHLELYGQNHRWEEGWYCPNFGEKLRNRILVLGGDEHLPVTISYKILYGN